MPREMTTIMGFRKNWRILMVDNSVKIWIKIRRGKGIVQKYVKKSVGKLLPIRISSLALGHFLNICGWDLLMDGHEVNLHTF